MTYLVAHPAIVLARLGEHCVLVGLSLVIACLIAFPLGIAAARSRRFGDVILATLGVIYTIPSLALLAVLVPWLGLGAPTAIVALVIYAQMLLVRNIVAGLRGVDPALVEAATGLGLTSIQRLARVELPAAVPAIVAGLRVTTVSLVALATVASYIHAGGLGDLVFEGIHHDDPQMIVAGSVAAAALAFAADAALARLERTVRPA
jgi:osmoprotectant transport system permease protein